MTDQSEILLRHPAGFLLREHGQMLRIPAMNRNNLPLPDPFFFNIPFAEINGRFHTLMDCFPRALLDPCPHRTACAHAGSLSLCGVVWFERYGYVSTERSVVCVLVGLVGGLHVSTVGVHDGVLVSPEGVLDGVLVSPEGVLDGVLVSP